MGVDYIGWIIGIVGIIFAIYYGKQNKDLKNNSQQIHINAEKVVQHNYYNNAPTEIRERLDFIVNKSATSTIIKTKKDNKDKG